MITSPVQSFDLPTNGQTLTVTRMHLGTVVEISGHADSLAAARDGIDAAFEEVALIHRLMSFHQKDSDVSRLNRYGSRGPVIVDPRTVEVIRAACEASRVSNGCFDVTVAPELVRSGHLPQPPSARAPNPGASWRDIEILTDDAVVFHTPLWLDLGGIAKGYAVDRAFEVCSNSLLSTYFVNAGGDIRISEGITASMKLDAPGSDSDTIGNVELTDGSIASSCGWRNAISKDDQMTGCHFDGMTRGKVNPTRFVSVLAQDCIVADALTKVVLSLGRQSQPMLSRYAASAIMHDVGRGWTQLLSH